MAETELKSAKKGRPIKPVGRVNFVLRTLVVTAMAYALEFVAEGLLHLELLPRYVFVPQRIIVFSLVGMFWFRPVDGRLADAGLARWIRYPVFIVWLVSISLPVVSPQLSILGLVLFSLLLISGGAIRGQLASTASSASDPDQLDRVQERDDTRPKGFSSLPPVGRIAFLRALLTLICLWLPLIRLEDVSANEPGAWFARLGYVILCIAWAVKAIGRLEDAGKPPTVRQGLAVIGLFLSLGLLRRVDMSQSSQRWWDFPVFITASALMRWLSELNGYEKLGLFLAIQVPLAFLPSTPLRTRIDLGNARAQKANKPSKTNVLALCGPFEYLRILLVISAFCVPLIYMDYASHNGVGSWIARIGYAVLAFFWLTFAHGRLKDAGWAHSEYPSQYFLVVSVGSLMPFAFRWVNGYGALVIFIILQIPTLFLKSVPLPDDDEA